MKNLPRDWGKLLAALILLTAVSLGCGGGGQFLAVSGTVNYDGQPVEKGTIGFIKSDGDSASRVGTTIADGRYEFTGSEGLTAGTYQVAIFAERPGGRKIQADEGSSEMVQPMVQYIPSEYNNRTELSAELAESRDDLNFDLKKPVRKPTRRR